MKSVDFKDIKEMDFNILMYVIISAIEKTTQTDRAKYILNGALEDLGEFNE